MRMLSNVTLFLLLCHCITYAMAGTPTCIPVLLKSDGHNMTLPGTSDPKKPVVYFFQNKSPQSLWIDHPTQRERGASAGWASYIRPNNWSAIVLNRKNFAISCSSIQPGKVESLNCAKTLAICSPQNMVTTTPLSGNYWIAEDKNWQRFIATIEKRGASFK